mgnify:CR=1 FL=1
MKFKFLFPLYIVSFVSLLLYSYTQIDLNLTLSKFEPILSSQRFFQQIGYFQRPLSTALYLGIIGILFLLYLLSLNLAKERKLAKLDLWKIILFGGIILTFSYNAFSYDLFNYIFDAKIVTYYGQNPYTHKALDYQGDPMLNFMRWTHRTYPYGPSWLTLTVPLSFLGFNFFLPTAILFKSLATAAYFGTVLFIGKILRRVDPKNAIFGVVFFALNPLVIVESLVSAHLDIIMMFFGVLAFYLLISKRYIPSFLALIFSIGIKFATVFLIPIFVWVWYKRGSVNWERVVKFSTILMSASVIAASFRTNFQPWYLISVLPFAALLSKRSYILIPTLILSFSSLLIYVPFLYTGNWDPPIPTILFWINAIAVSLVVFLISGKVLINGRIKL